MWYIAVFCLMAANGCLATEYPLLYQKPPHIENNPIDLCELASRGHPIERPWYVTYRLAPCYFYERVNIDNIKVILELPESVEDCKMLIAPVYGCRTFRGSEGCDRLYERWQFIGPRTYSFHNNMGGLNQGESVVTHPLDNDHYAVIWTCFRQARANPLNPESGKCLAPGIEVLTREKYPPPSVLDAIESNLRDNFNIPLDALTSVPQNNECQDDDFGINIVCPDNSTVHCLLPV